MHRRHAATQHRCFLSSPWAIFGVLVQRRGFMQVVRGRIRGWDTKTGTIEFLDFDHKPMKFHRSAVAERLQPLVKHSLEVKAEFTRHPTSSIGNITFDPTVSPKYLMSNVKGIVNSITDRGFGFIKPLVELPEHARKEDKGVVLYFPQNVVIHDRMCLRRGCSVVFDIAEDKSAVNLQLEGTRHPVAEDVVCVITEYNGLAGIAVPTEWSRRNRDFLEPVDRVHVVGMHEARVGQVVRGDIGLWFESSVAARGASKRFFKLTDPVMIMKEIPHQYKAYGKIVVPPLADRPGMVKIVQPPPPSAAAVAGGGGSAAPTEEEAETKLLPLVLGNVIDDSTALSTQCYEVTTPRWCVRGAKAYCTVAVDPVIRTQDQSPEEGPAVIVRAIEAARYDQARVGPADDDAVVFGACCGVIIAYNRTTNSGIVAVDPEPQRPHLPTWIPLTRVSFASTRVASVAQEGMRVRFDLKRRAENADVKFRACYVCLEAVAHNDDLDDLALLQQTVGTEERSLRVSGEITTYNGAFGTITATIVDSEHAVKGGALRDATITAYFDRGAFVTQHSIDVGSEVDAIIVPQSELAIQQKLPPYRCLRVTHSPVYRNVSGVVTSLTSKEGRIACRGKSYHFHRSAVASTDRAQLTVGSLVTFDVVRNTHLVATQAPPSDEGGRRNDTALSDVEVSLAELAESKSDEVSLTDRAVITEASQGGGGGIRKTYLFAINVRAHAAPDAMDSTQLGRWAEEASKPHDSRQHQQQASTGDMAAPAKVPTTQQFLQPSTAKHAVTYRTEELRRKLPSLGEHQPKVRRWLDAQHQEQPEQQPRRPAGPSHAHRSLASPPRWRGHGGRTQPHPTRGGR